MQAWNEVPVQYLDQSRLVYGIIDRLVIQPDGTLMLIDYKTHRSATRDTIPDLAHMYREQLHLYMNGVTRLWPGHGVKPCLLFTACNEMVMLEDLN